MALGVGSEKLSLALKAFFADRELEELTGSRLTVRSKAPDEPRPARSGGRGSRTSIWRIPVDLRHPAPFPTRPISADGGRSFHLRVVSQSRGAEKDKKGLPGGAAFDRYITDGLDRKAPDAASYDRYVTDARDQVGAAAEDDAQRETRVLLILSTIGDTAADRRAFWDERSATARRRGAHVIEIVPERASAAQWCALAEDDAVPARVREVALEAASSARDIKHAGKPHTLALVLESQEEISWAREARKQYGKRKDDPALHYVEPRGGEIQRRVDLELPARATLREAALIAHQMACILTHAGLPYVMTMHGPDALNDRRNGHLHLAIYPQRGERDEYGRWLFGKAILGGKLRPGQLAELLGGTSTLALSGHHTQRAAADLAVLRQVYADICNKTIASGGRNARMDPRSYAAMGIDQEPAEHLGTVEARLVYAGIATERSKRNATRSWAAEVRRRETAVEREWAELKAEIDRRWPARERGTEGAHVAEIETELDAVIEDKKASTRLEARLEIARSGPLAMQERASRMLDAIAAGKASAAEVKQREAVAARLRLAESHLAEIDEQIEPLRAAVEVERAALARREGAVRQSIEEVRERDHAAPQAVADLLARIRREKLPVIMPDGGGRPVVHGLSAAERDVLDRPHTRAAADRALAETAVHQCRQIDRVLAAVRANGYDATRSAVRGQTKELRADAVLLQAYRSHPTLKAELPSANAAWLACIAREKLQSPAPVTQPAAAQYEGGGPAASRMGTVTGAARLITGSANLGLVEGGLGPSIGNAPHTAQAAPSSAMELTPGTGDQSIRPGAKQDAAAAVTPRLPAIDLAGVPTDLELSGRGIESSSPALPSHRVSGSVAAAGPATERPAGKPVISTVSGTQSGEPRLAASEPIEEAGRNRPHAEPELEQASDGRADRVDGADESASTVKRTVAAAMLGKVSNISVAQAPGIGPSSSSVGRTEMGVGSGAVRKGAEAGRPEGPARNEAQSSERLLKSRSDPRPPANIEPALTQASARQSTPDHARPSEHDAASARPVAPPPITTPVAPAMKNAVDGAATRSTAPEMTPAPAALSRPAPGAYVGTGDGAAAGAAGLTAKALENTSGPPERSTPHANAGGSRLERAAAPQSVMDKVRAAAAARKVPPAGKSIDRAPAENVSGIETGLRTKPSINEGRDGRVANVSKSDLHSTSNQEESDLIHLQQQLSYRSGKTR